VDKLEGKLFGELVGGVREEVKKEHKYEKVGNGTLTQKTVTF